MFENIDNLKARLDTLRPLPVNTVKSLHEQMVLEWTYNSNAIEGNTLTIKETKVVLEGITIGGKSMREHFEAINHQEAIFYVEDLVSSDEPFTEHTIKSIHQLVLKNIDAENAGVYRSENVIISGAEHVPPDFINVPEQMAAIVAEYTNSTYHPIERAARLHTDFVNVHPFIDGNGRTARLLMNFELMKSGYLPVIIKANERLAYYESLDKASISRDYREFVEIVAKAEVEATEKVLTLVERH